MPDNLNQPKVASKTPLEPAPEIIASPSSSVPPASQNSSIPPVPSSPPPPPPPLPKSEILTPDIAPKKPSKAKIILVSLVGLVLLGAVAGAVVLVQQRQQTGVSAGSAAPACPEGYADGGTHGECCACGKAKEVRTCTAPDGSQTWTNSDCVHDAPNCTDGCSPVGDCVSEGSSGCTTKSCCTASNVCHNNVCTACGSITNEGTCWTHSNCHWANGSCQTGAMPTVTGDCKIDCGADRNGVSVTAQAGSETACSGAVVTATYFAKTCNSSNSCTGATTTTTGGLPFTRSTIGDDCGYYQTDIVASTNKGGSCRNASAGPLGACITPTITTGVTPTVTTGVTPTVTTPTYDCECAQISAYSTSWVELTSDDLTELKAGDVINLTVQGATTGGGDMDKARFKINGGNWQETGNTKTFNSSTWKFYIEYTIPANTTSFNIEAEVHLVETDRWY